MKGLLPSNPFCSTFGHNFFLVEKFNSNIQEIKCKCCKKKFIPTNEGDLIELTINVNEIDILIDYLDYQENRLQKKIA
tara:strand:- start:71492 stop:71725 length:234 start_codon:yes stop_codon:yes gene_type:complete